jgi:2-polyprenyl-3-methyl-5-hydroxy-6-metoxy-1,4-benzoquinol methylase
MESCKIIFLQEIHLRWKMAWDIGWDEIFKEHEWGRYPPEELIRFVSRNFLHYPNHEMIKILEVGCGPGANIWFLSREGYSAIGIDGSKVAIDIAMKRLKTEGLTAEIRVGDVTHIPYQNDFFDAVIDI